MTDDDQGPFQAGLPKSKFIPDKDHQAKTAVEASHKDDALFVTLANAIVPATMEKTATDKQVRDRLEALWIWWQE